MGIVAENASAADFRRIDRDAVLFADKAHVVVEAADLGDLDASDLPPAAVTADAEIGPAPQLHPRTGRNFFHTMITGRPVAGNARDELVPPLFPEIVVLGVAGRTGFALFGQGRLETERDGHRPAAAGRDVIRSRLFFNDTSRRNREDQHQTETASDRIQSIPSRVTDAGKYYL